MQKFLTSIGAVVVSLVIIAVAAFILGVFVMLLWNWLMPMIFGLTTISYIEGWGLAALCGLLFKSTSTTPKGND